MEQRIEIIEKSGLPGFDHNKISEKYSVSKPTNASILKDHYDMQMSNPANKKTMRKGKLHLSFYLFDYLSNTDIYIFTIY